jgi:hypothetical protein
MFEVRSFYHALCTPVGAPFHWNSIWRNKAPSRVAFFIWMAALRKILTLNNPRKRYIIMVDWCFMCKSYGETIYYFLLYCEVARELWVSIFPFFSVELVMPRRVMELSASWRG